MIVTKDYSSNKLQEAYRSGNLDLLDSINKFNSFSAAFDEKFLYSRNELQANSIDSHLNGQSAFLLVWVPPIFPVIVALLRCCEEWDINFVPVSWVHGIVG